ncbi:filamentous hemagglutinin N-terminal domain-containing protein, partial [Comamonas sp. Z3]|uniref:two-partner secretion domain-containing protein n=1 Tax=Comamonas sp. Z3 TaxID=2601247 RepID=UPI0011E6627D
MNKNLHRVIFNKARGIRMVVQETASSEGKAGNGSTQTGASDAGALSAGSLRTAKSFLSAFPFSAAAKTAGMLALALGAPAGFAQIIADPSAPNRQRPTVLESANGTPTVNIQTPSAGGVSRNTYQQFDIGQKGAILNNSRTNVQTQIGGWVQGNPWLANGSARVIVNEVNSAAQSRLMGPLEVAGQRADVIIANPSGLVVDGLSFINAAGVTLTTGRPLYGANGSLDGFNVQGGQISLQGSGMDATKADYANILARAISLNAGVWAQELKVVTGVNQITTDGSVQQSNPSPVGAESVKPGFALDVAQLGGMYAGRIFIVGTESGLGVRNAGTLSATTGGLTLSADGQLSNSGVIASNHVDANLNVSSKGIDNSGTLSSQRDITINDGGSGLSNSGAIQAGQQLTIQAGQLTNQSTGNLTTQRLDVTALDLNNAGSIAQTGSQDLRIQTASLSNSGSKAVLGAPSATTNGTGAGGGTGTDSGGAGSDGASTTAPPTSGQDGSAVQTSPVAPVVLATGNINVVQSLTNTGKIVANGATDVSTSQSLTNSGSVNARQLHSEGSLDNSQGSLVVQNFSGSQTALQNRSGSFYVQTDLKLDAQDLDNSSGTIGSAQSLTINAKDGVVNTAGTLTAGKDLTVQAQSVGNDSGRIVSNTGSVSLDTSGALSNLKGQIGTVSTAADAQVRIQAQSLENSRGEISQNGSGQLSIQVADAVQSNQGLIASNGSTQIKAASFSNDAGNVSALKKLDIASSQSISNVAGSMQAGDGSTTNVSDGSLKLRAGGNIDNRSGTLFANAALNAQATSIDNSKGSLATMGDMQVHTSGDSINNAGKIQANGNVDIQSTQKIENQSGVIASGGKLNLQTQNLQTQRGQVSAGKDATLVTQTLDNTEGSITQSSQGQLSITASAALTNGAGKIISNGDLGISAGQTNNQSGEITSLQNAQIQVVDLQSEQGVIQSGAALDLQSASDINARKGTIQSQGPLNIDAKGQLTSAEGMILSSDSASIQSAGLDNASGTISSTASIKIQTGALQNDQGTLAANNDLKLISTALSNQSGQIGAQSIAIDTRQGALNNDDGKIIASAGNLDVQSGALHSDKGWMQAAQDLQINTHGQTLTNTGTLLALGNASVDSGDLDNTSGTIQAGTSQSTATGTSNLTLNAAGALTNGQGTIAANNDLKLTSSALSNQSGQIGAQSIAIDTQQGALNNDDGKIIASAGNLDVQSGALHSDKGWMQAAQDLQIHTHGQALTNTGTLLAMANATVNSGDLHNTGGTIQAGTSQSAATGTSNLTLNAAGALTNGQGTIAANNDLKLTSSALSNQSGQIGAQSIAIDTQQGALNNDSGKIIASAGNLDVQSGALHSDKGWLQAAQDLQIHTHGQTLTNTGTMLALGNARIDSGNLDNTSGTIQAGTSQSSGSSSLNVTSAGVLTNDQGTIAANNDLQLNSTALSNQSGQIGAQSIAIDTRQGALNNDDGKVIASAGNLDVQSGALHSDKGWMQAAQDLQINTHGQTLTNTGTLLALGNASVDSGDLDNTSGTIQAGTSQSTATGTSNLTLNAAGALTNDQGTIAANNDLKLTSTALSNQSGQIGAQSIAIDTRQGALNNDDGKIIASAGNLDVQSGALHSDKGWMQAAQDLQIHTHGQALTNTGTLLALGNATVNSGDLHNTGGTIQAGTSQSTATGASNLTLNAAGALTNGQGTISANNDLKLTSTALSNQSGQIGAQSITIDSRQGALNNDDGKIIASAGNLDVQSGALHSDKGWLQAAKDLQIHTHGQSLTNTGTMLALGNATVNSGDLHNTGGTIQAGTSQSAATGASNLTLNAAGALTNDQGTIAANNDLQLNSTALSNQSGQIGAQSITIDTRQGALNNDDGKIIASAGNLDVQSGALHSDKGWLQAAKDLQIHTHGQTLTNTGTMLALGNARIDSGNLDNTGGTIQAGTSQSSGSSSLNVTSAGVLTNDQGTIAANNDLQLNSTALSNQSGQIGAQSITIDSRQGALNNDDGKIIASAGNLDVQSGALHSDKGWMQAAQDLQIHTHGQTLTNTGTMLALGNARIDSGDLDNTSGTIQAGGEASAAAALSVQSTGTITNAGGHLLASTDVGLIANALDNSNGEVGAGRHLTVQTQAAVSNSAGKLVGNAGVDLKSASLLNDRQAVIGSSMGDVNIATGVLDNRSGVITAQGSASVTSQSLDNTQGQIGAGRLSLNTQGQQLINTDGQILASSGDLSLQSGWLDNQRGRIAALQNATLTSNGIRNDEGRITADSLQIQSRDGAGTWSAVSNQGGAILADQRLQLDSAALNNTAGAIQTTASISTLAIDSHGGDITNQQSGNAGGIVSSGTLNIDAQEGRINNSQGGYIGASGDTHISGSRVSNQGGAIASNSSLQVSSTAADGIAIDNTSGGSIQSTADIKLYASTAEIANTGGSIIANNDLLIQSSGKVNNDQGVIKAGHDLSVVDAGVAGGSALNSATQTLSNQGGTLFAGNNFGIKNQGLSGAGSLQAQGGMQLAFAGNYIHQGELSVNGDLSVESGGDFTNQGSIKGGSSVTVSGNNVDNQGGAEISSAGVTTVNASQTLTNRGLIDGSDTRVNAGAMDNVGTGRIYGDHVSISAGTLSNRSENGTSATIASREDLDIGAVAVNNQGGATLLSLGNMRFGGALDANRFATGQAQVINNTGSRIDATGSLSMVAAVVNNTNAGIEIARQEFVGTHAGESLVQLPGQQPESASLYREVWSGTFIPFYDYSPFSPTVNGIPGNRSDGRIFKPVHPDKFLTTIPVAYKETVSCGSGDDTSPCTYTYTYEPAGSTRFAEYGIAVPVGYSTIPPQPLTYGAYVGESGTVYWPPGSNQGGYEAAQAVYVDSIAAAKNLNDAILAQMQEYNRIETSSRDYTIIDGVTESVYRDRVLSSKPGQITAGGNIDISGALNNSDSTVIAGGSINVGQLNNQSTVEGVETKALNGTAVFYSWKYHGGFSSSQERRASAPQAFASSQSTTFELPTVVFLQNQAGTGPVDSVGANHNTGSNASGNGATATGAGSANGSAGSIAQQGGPGAQGPSASGQQAVGLQSAAAASGGAANESEAIAATQASQQVALGTNTGSIGSLAGANAAGADGAVQSGAVNASALAGASINAAGSSGAGAGVTGNVPTVSQQPITSANGEAVVVRTVSSGPTLPSSSLYVVNAQNGNHPLVETDPAFTNRQNWLSSDYMLQALSLDPALQQKRLGDGFYEQQLVQQQIAQLTGRRFLGDYTSNDAQYQALLQNGTTFAKAHGLRPGVELSAEQVAQLTSDLVWLVSQNVAMADGSVQSVLVPKVYVVARPGDLSATGTLISGDTISVKTDGDVNNSGTIAGRRAVLIAANDINNIGGHIVSDSVSLSAGRDINVVGGTVSAALQLLAQAGNDINVVTTTRTTSGGTAQNGYSNTVIDRVAGLAVTGPLDADLGQGGVMALNAGNDINLQAAQITNAVENGVTRINAGNDVNLSTLNISTDNRITWDPKNHLFFGGSQEAGTQINTQGTTVIRAGNDINARAAQVQTTQDLRLSAGKDVNITAGQATQSLDNAYFTKSSGLLGSSTKTLVDNAHQTQAQGSGLGGDTIAISAGRDITVAGSNVVSDNGTALQAGRHVNIVAVEETSSEQHLRKSTSSGLLGGGAGIGVTIGSRMQSTDQAITGTSAAGSTVGSINGNVNIVAGESYRQVGSDVMAPKADINIVAKDIAITEAEQRQTSETHTRLKQSGLSVSIGSAVISAGQTAQSMAEAAGKTSDARMQALAAGAAALNAYNQGKDIGDAAGALASGNPSAAGSISVSVGSSKSQSDSYQSGTISHGSSVQAGGNVNLIATGAGKDSNILIQGSDITAGKDATLMADNQITLLASQDSHSDRSTNSNSSGSIGVSVGANTGITASVSQGKGHANSDDVSYNNTHITAGNSVTLQSGGDTHLKGAVVSGKQVIAD